MRCDEVINELAVPADNRERAALAEHLARCPACAATARKFAALDRAWDATRPSEPSSDRWDAVWDRIVSSLDVSVPQGSAASGPASVSQNGSPVTVPLPRSAAAGRPLARRRNWVPMALVGVAQAAAVLLAVGLLWYGSSTPRPTQVVDNGRAASPLSPSPTRDGTPALPAIPTVDVEEGSLVVIMIPGGGEKPTVVDRTPEWMSFGVDDWYLVYNAVEALASPVVAMKE
jgi:hypothetical protein